MSTDRPLRETSYGGVVLRGDDVLVITPTGKRRVTGLPKGGPQPGETGEQTATREVREETGIQGRLLRRLGDVEYRYRRKNGKPRPKKVTFYLFEYLSGDVADHDHEVEEALWMPLEEARSALTFPGEREMVERALALRGR